MEHAGAPLDPQELQAALQARRLGKKIHYFPEIDSTNRLAFHLAQEGAEEGEVVVAEGQTHGKGRMGRNWFSPPYFNLYLSVILRPKLPPTNAPQLTLMAAVALAETVQFFLASPPVIKWPNDILAGGRKLAGILTESSCETGRVHFVVVGVGVNLNLPAAARPDEIRDYATSLLILTGRPVDRNVFARQLINALDRCYGELEREGFRPIARRWESFFGFRNRKVTVGMADRRVSGIARGIDGAGALIVEEEGGALRKVIAGEVIPIES